MAVPLVFLHLQLGSRVFCVCEAITRIPIPCSIQDVYAVCVSPRMAEQSIAAISQADGSLPEDSKISIINLFFKMRKKGDYSFLAFYKN